MTSVLSSVPPSEGGRPSTRTAANVITLARTLISVPLSLVALHQSSWGLLAAAYAVYWIGDILDGWTARRLKQETVVGAVLDIVCDRACTTVAAVTFVHLAPAAALPLAVFLLQFCVLDMMLSLAFVPLGVKSPNYFYRVDREIYRLNWSPIAKALNTSLVVLAAVAGQYVIATLIALALLAVKAVSLRRLLIVVWPRASSQHDVLAVQ